jgi:hypothetical protein
MNGKHGLFTAALLAAAIIGTAGCRQATGSSRARTGSITLNIGIGGMPQNSVGTTAWTILPDMEAETHPFSRYAVTFTNTAGGAAHEAVEANYSELRSGMTIDDIVAGTYTVTVTAYTGTQSNWKEVGRGSVADVTVSAGTAATATILLGPITEATDKGELSYNIFFPDGVTGKLYLCEQTGQTETETLIRATNTLADKGLTGNKPLDPGIYMVRLTLEWGYLKAGLTEVVHIYSGVESILEKRYEETDFTSEKPITNTNLTNMFAAPKWGMTAEITFTGNEQYSGSINWTPSLAANNVFKTETAYTANVTLRAKPGWTFKGMAANSFSYEGADSVTSSEAMGDTDNMLTVYVNFPATGSEQYEITVTAALEAIIVEGDLTGISISASTPRTFTAKAGYTDIKWYVDGSTTLLSSENSITIEASAYDPGGHSVTVTGIKDGKRYSQSIPFTVVWSEAATAQ